VEFRASHILIGVEPSASKEEKEKKLKTAKDILAKIRSGEDFSKLAMRYSTDQGSAPIGGDIGAFHKGMADEAFEKAVLSLKVGEVSDVVETLYGYHIIMLTGLKPQTQLAFDEVKNDIKNKIEKKRADELYKKWMEDLKAKAKIEIIKK
jgi:parvulin-like peptidyl-prolyl isomerase